MSDLKNDLKNVPYIKQFFGEYLDLRKDKDNEALIVESIRNGVEFKGTNLWILIFAIFIASLGLNVNSPENKLPVDYSDQHKYGKQRNPRYGGAIPNYLYPHQTCLQKREEQTPYPAKPAHAHAI
jgi:hypothetical protein